MKRKRRVHAGRFKPGNEYHKLLCRDSQGRFIRGDTAGPLVDNDDLKKIEEKVDKLLEQMEK